MVQKNRIAPILAVEDQGGVFVALGSTTFSPIKTDIERTKQEKRIVPIRSAVEDHVAVLDMAMGSNPFAPLVVVLPTWYTARESFLYSILDGDVYLNLKRTIRG